MIATNKTNILVSPSALALSLLLAGGQWRLPIQIARSRLDFMHRAFGESPTIGVVTRDWLSVLDLRRLALRRVFTATPRLVLVLRRDETPTTFERKYFDAVIVTGEVFAQSASRLQTLVGNAHTPHRLPPLRPVRALGLVA